MSYSPPPVNRYLENDVLSRSPEWLVPLLYEHLVASLRRLQIQMDKRDLNGMAKDTEKATRILAELLGTLDVEKGGKLAKDLSALYTFYMTELLIVIRKRDNTTLARITKQFEGLHEVWVKAAEQVAPRVNRSIAMVR